LHAGGVQVRVRARGESDRSSCWDQAIAAGADYILTDVPEELIAHVLNRQLKPRPVRFALHRGASRYAPENTLLAYEKAYRLHADFVEFDVRTSQDGQFFLLHDGRFDRTTNGKGPIREATTDAISRLDAGDWFNRVDWTGNTSAWKSGLPPAGANQGDWPLIQGFFAVGAAAVGPANIASASAHVAEMLRIRKSSPLFRLRAGADVTKRVDFLNVGASQTPGLIVMTVTDGTCAGADLDPTRDALVVIVNADKVSRSYTIAGATGFTLHPIQQGSTDPVVRTATFSGGTFTVPARTTAVFEQLQTGPQGAGVACNTRVSI
jgi:hypothetical protein